jgi:hypothetical protein
MTLHAALMLGDHYRNALSTKSKRDLITMWEGVDYLFIDEISMVGCAMLHDISRALSVAKGNDSAFGGISVIFAGDFAELPPVGQKKLFAHLDSNDITRAATTYGQKVVFGKLLWLSVDTVVMLSQNMRQTGPENARFVELLGCLRHGKCNVADYELLKTRLASNVDIDWTSGPWKDAPIIVAENAMKDMLNEEMARDFATSSGNPLHWYYAIDTLGRNKPIANPALEAQLMALDSGKTNSRLGHIPLVIGMPVMITQNFDVPGGVVNGCHGTLVSVRYQLGNDGRRYAISCVVHAPDTTLGIMPELPDYHVVSMRDSVNISLKHPHTGSTLTVKRTQVPIMPGFAMTAYKAQGKTLDACVVNFTGCFGTEPPYVMVSRATSLEALIILTPFPISKISCHESQDVREEMRRAGYLDLTTTVSYGTAAEASNAAAEIKASFASATADETSSDASDPDIALRRVVRIEQRNAEPTLPRRTRVPVSTPITGITSSSSASAVSTPAPAGKKRQAKRRLDDKSAPRPSKRARN